MALSRIALLALALAVAPAAAAAQPVTAEQAIEVQRESVRSVVSPDCPEAVGDEIVVCGEREQERYRLPLPVERIPGAADRAGGEQVAAMNQDSSLCTPVGRNQRCTRGLDMLGIGFAIIRGIQAIRARRD